MRRKEEIKLQSKQKHLEHVNKNKKNKELEKNQECNWRVNGCDNALLIRPGCFGVNQM